MTEKELLQRLFTLRDALRLSAGTKVCSDATINEIVRMKPEEKNELLYINGVGRVFVEKYGDAFMEVLSEYHRAERLSLAEINGGVLEVLKTLENRLVNISRRNRLLYMPKLSDHAVDLCPSGKNGDKLLAFLHRRDDARLKICAQSDEKRLRTLRKIKREAERLKRETGENCLYIAYPFVIGKLIGDFDVRAPLVLFPVELSVTDEATVRIAAARDVLFNSNLVLTHYKFGGVNAPLPDDDCDPDDVFGSMRAYYDAAGLKTPPPQGVTAFAEYRADEFPKHKQGELHIDPCAVIGLFSVSGSAIRRDFKNIVAHGKINDQLHDLLGDIEDVDFYADSEAEEAATDASASERTIHYIHPLDGSQERAIRYIDAHDRLVVQGPPGTGKSQTITGIIADAVNKGGNVLMVSQKKAALDVIYSRLGRLSEYAVLLNDVQDKDAFYGQISRIFMSEQSIDYSGARLDALSRTVDSGIARLENIADKLYYNDGFAGAPMYRLYAADSNNTFRRDIESTTAVYRSCVSAELLQLGYPRLREIKQALADKGRLARLKEQYDLQRRFSWLEYVVSDTMTLFEINEALAQIRAIVDCYVQFHSYNPIKRLFRRREIRRPLKRFVKRYFKKGCGTLVKTFAADPTELYNGFEQYGRYFTLRGEPIDEGEKLYFDAIYNIARATEETLSTVNGRLFEFCTMSYISTFEGANRDVLAEVDAYDSTVRAVCAAIDEKRQVTRDCMKAALVRAYRDNIALSKRYGEMHRVAESKRRWSVARFVDKFGFELFKGIRIWLMTPETVSEVLPLDTELFDLLVFDEASQIYIERGVPSIMRARKVVIAGDHKQLRPSSLGDGRIETEDDENAALDEESLLDLARFKYPEIMLDCHYRSRYEELIAFSNHAFYKGRLHVSPNVQPPAAPPITVIYTPTGKWDDRKNLVEAKTVVECLRRFFCDREPAETIGVITFNRAQRDLIEDLIEEECRKDPAFAAACTSEFSRSENGEDVGLFIKNIENVQGDERDRIVFSLAYAKNEQGRLMRNFGWLNQLGGENRLNVAVSRAKRKITIISSIRADDLKTDDLKNEGPRLFCEYLRYAEFVSAGNAEGAASVLQSFGNMEMRSREMDGFADIVCATLCERGLHVRRNIGIGGYSLDMAVMSADGIPLLGIECDASAYRQSSARERDIYLRRYFETRGWKLFRIWASDWWRDTEKVIRRIRSAAGL